MVFFCAVTRSGFITCFAGEIEVVKPLLIPKKAGVVVGRIVAGGSQVGDLAGAAFDYAEPAILPVKLNRLGVG